MQKINLTTIINHRYMDCWYGDAGPITAYADWLAEHNNREAAENIRLQVALYSGFEDMESALAHTRVHCNEEINHLLFAHWLWREGEDPATAGLRSEMPQRIHYRLRAELIILQCELERIAKEQFDLPYVFGWEFVEPSKIHGSIKSYGPAFWAKYQRCVHLMKKVFPSELIISRWAQHIFSPDAHRYGNNTFCTMGPYWRYGMVFNAHGYHPTEDDDLFRDWVVVHPESGLDIAKYRPVVLRCSMDSGIRNLIDGLPDDVEGVCCSFHGSGDSGCVNDAYAYRFIAGAGRDTIEPEIHDWEDCGELDEDWTYLLESILGRYASGWEDNEGAQGHIVLNVSKGVYVIEFGSNKIDAHCYGSEEAEPVLKGKLEHEFFAAGNDTVATFTVTIRESDYSLYHPEDDADAASVPKEIVDKLMEDLTSQVHDSEPIERDSTDVEVLLKFDGTWETDDTVVYVEQTDDLVFDNVLDVIEDSDQVDELYSNLHMVLGEAHGRLTY